MDFTDLISPNDYVGQNFPAGLPDAADGGGNLMDAMEKLRTVLGMDAGAKSGVVDPDQIPAMDSSIGRFVNPDDLMRNGPQGTSGATDFSARRRDVPLPMARPAEAPQAMPPMAPQQPMLPQGTDLRSAVMGQPTTQSILKNAMASLGGGLSTVEGNTGGGAFSRGMGGAIKSGTAADNTDFDQSIKALNAVQQAKQFGTNEDYKKALTNYYKVLTDQKTKEATALAAKPTATAAAAVKPAAAPGTEIKMQGDGTDGTPYQPASKDDYDEIESGAYYIHPGSGKKMKKK